MAFGCLYHLLGPGVLDRELDLWRRIDPAELRLMQQMLEKGLNSPLTSSAGRLFDAVSAIVGVRDVTDYEGQAAIELEMLADFDSDEAYEFDFAVEPTHRTPTELSQAGGETVAGKAIIIDPTSVISAILLEADAGVSVGMISTRFHNGVADVITRICEAVRDTTGVSTVTLSGGVFQNAYLLRKTLARLEGSRFTVLQHRQVPPNDGCISLGQAAIAQARKLAR